MTQPISVVDIVTSDESNPLFTSTPSTTASSPDISPNVNGVASSPPDLSKARCGWRRPFTLVSRFVRTHVSSSTMLTGGMQGMKKALLICLALAVIVIIGAFSLRQLLDPQIESLNQERNDLKESLRKTQFQVENMTRIAESRLETIHLLEQELEKQAVKAQTTPATAYDDEDPNERFRPAILWPTFLYTMLMGCIVLSCVIYRIYCIFRAEHEVSKFQWGQLPDEAGSPSHMLLSGGRTPPLSSISLSSVESTGGALSPILQATANNHQKNGSPQCYKRPGSNSPEDNLMHV